MKKWIIGLWTSAVLFCISVRVLAEVVDPSEVDTNSELFALLGQVLEAAKAGQGSLAAALGLAVIIALLRNSGKIPIAKALKLNLLVQKIPKQWFPVVVAGLGAALGIATGVASGLPLLSSLQAGFETALMSSGLHELAKRPLQSLGLLPKNETGKKK